MKIKSPENKWLQNCSLVALHENDGWLEKQRVAGKVVAGCLSMLEQMVKDGTTKTLLELDKIAESFIRDSKCEPTFKGYKNYPLSVCISIDNDEKNEMVHGIPKPDDVLRSGNIVKFDLGATHQNAIADSAISLIYGCPKSEKHTILLKDTRNALMAGIKSIKVGDRLGNIGNAIYSYGSNRGYGVITGFGGHGLGWGKPHDFPFVANKAEKNEYIRIVPGLSIAIEPMFCLGGTKTTKGLDGWTINCEPGVVSSHWEHSIYVHQDRVEIITLRENEHYEN